MMNWCILIVFAACLAVSVTSEFFRLQRGYEYVYKEEVKCNLGKAGALLVKAKVSFTPIKKEDGKLEISQAVYHVVIQDMVTGQQSQFETFDFGKWFSFVISLDHGDIEKVFHPPDEDDMILGMKKSFATLVFGKLHLHDDPSLQDVRHDPDSGRWNYSTLENGHEGLHNASYMAEPTDRGIRFTKTRTQHPNLKTAVNNYKKVLHYESHTGLISRVNVDEFLEIGKAPKGFDPFENERPALPNDTYIHAEIPTMTASSSGSAELLARNRLRGPGVVKPKDGLVDGMVHIQWSNKKQQWKKVKDPDYPKHLRGNFSCLQKVANYGSVQAYPCFEGLVTTLKNLQDEELVLVTEQVFNTNLTLLQRISPKTDVSSDSLHLVDALAEIGTNISVALLVEHAFQSNPDIMKRMFMHFSLTEQHSFEVFETTLEQFCFFPETFPPSVQDEEIHHQALLALGSLVAYHHANGRSENAHRLIGKLEEMLGLHDAFKYNGIRSTLSVDDAGRFDMRHVVLLESLGNAAMERSYNHIISYANATTQTILKRSALHALRQYQRDEAVTTLYQAATKDNSQLIKHEAALILQRHKRKTMYPLVRPPGQGNKMGPVTRETARHHRAKRELFKPFKFRLESPSIDWRKMIGSKSVGATFGLIIWNLLDIVIAPRKGHAVVDIHDEAYAKLHVGIVGFNYDFLVARICFNGKASYSLNILQELSFKALMKQIKDFFNIVGDTVDAVKDGVKLMQQLINGKINIKDILENFIKALEDMPNKIADIGRRGVKAMEMIGMFDDRELPPFLRPAKNVIIRITNLYNSIKTDIMNFYNKVQDAVIAFKRSYKTIYESIKAILKVIPNFLDSPKQALAAVFKGVLNIQHAVTDFLEAKNQLMDACFFLKDEKPEWWDLKTHYIEIKKDVIAALKAVRDGGKKWINEIVTSDDPIAKLTNGKLTGKKLKEKFLAEVKAVIDILVNPFETLLGDLAQPFLEAYQKVMGIIQKIKDAYEMLKKGYNKARQIIAILFGPRVHARFPRTTRLADSGKCAQSGFYPSNSAGYPSGDGVDLSIAEGAVIVAPFAGKISRTRPNEIRILVVDGSLSNTYIYVTNIKPNSTIQSEKDGDYSELEVFAGQVLGMATGTACRPGMNHLHLVMRKTNGDFIDPTNFLAKRLLEIPKWESFCNDYKYIFRNKVLAVGWSTPGAKKDEMMPAKPGKPTTSMKPNDKNEPEEEQSDMMTKMNGANRRRKRGLFKGKDSLLSKLGFPKLGQSIMKTLKKFNFKNLKLGKIVNFLDSLGMKESTKQLAQVILRIKELIDSKPCFNPHQLTDDQLRNELADRLLPATGSREQMVQRILHTEPQCPLIQLKMPKQIYCVFDENCLAVQCCMNIKVMMFNKAVRAFARLDPCDFKFVIGVDSWKYTLPAKDIYLNLEGTLKTGIKFGMFDMDLEVVIRYKIEKTENVALFSFSVAACSQDDMTSCAVDVPLLDEAVIPLPHCKDDGTFVWPKVDWNEFFSLDKVKERLKEAGKKVVKVAAAAVTKEILKKLGIAANFLVPNGPCGRPEIMNFKKLQAALKKRGLSVIGSRPELNDRLTDDDLTCKIGTKSLALPRITNPTLKKLLYYKISPKCSRIDACVEFSIKRLRYTKSFRAYADIDVCKYIVKVGFEHIVHPIPIFVFPWGEPQQLKISDNVYVSYTIARDDIKKVFVVDLGVKMCLAKDDCPIDAPIMTKKEIPQPLCNDNFTMDAFKPGDGSLGKFLKELGGKMNTAAFNYILRLFKLDKILTDTRCVKSTTSPTCPWSLSLAGLPPSVRTKLTCRLADNCFGAGCCLHLPFKLPFVKDAIHKYILASFEFDPCEFTIKTQFGSEIKTKKLGHYNWGEVSTFEVGHGDPAPLRMVYSIKKDGKNVILNMKVTICLKIEGKEMCIPDENGMEVFKDKVVPLCDANAMVALAKSFEAKSLKDYLKAQGMEFGKAIVGAGVDMFLEQTGLGKHLKQPKCDSGSDPYIPSVDGWKNDCKESIYKLPKLPNFVKCHFDKSCTSVQCCVDVDFYGMYSNYFHFYVTLDTCDLIFKTGFEKMSFSRTLLKHHWGKVENFNILKMFNIKYSIKKNNEKKIFTLNAELCVSFEKNGVCDHKIKFMDDTEIPQLQCDLTKGIANLPTDINSLKKYMGKLGTAATGLALMIPLRMLGLGSIIGLEGLCPDPKKPIKNTCPHVKDFKITLPSVSSSMSCAIQPDCHGIECCVGIDLGFMQRNFRTLVTVDILSYKLTVGFEKWRFMRYLFTYQWGQEETVSLGSAINLIFSIGKTKTFFIFNLRLESTVADYLPVYVTVLRDYMFPIPIINKGAVAKFPFNSWQDFKNNVGSQAGDMAWEATMKFLGLEDVIDGSLCSPVNYKTDRNKEICPHLTMPNLPSAVKCQFDDLCMGVTCCVDLDFGVVKKTLKAWMIIDSAKPSISTGFERKRYDRTIDDSFFGDRMTLKISKFFNMIFKVTKVAATKMLSVALTLQMKLFDEIVEVYALENFLIPQTFSNPDWSLGAALDEFRFLRGSVTNAIMKRLDLSKSFFDLKPCPLPSTKPLKTACPFTLPQWLTNKVRVITNDNCLGLQACIRFKILSIEYEFKVAMEFIPKEYKLRVAVEKWEMVKYIFENFGQENTFLIRNALGVTYKLETNDQGQLVTSLGIKICLDGHCTAPIQLLDKAPVPMPYVKDDGTLVWPAADPSKMKDWLYNKALETTKDLLDVGKDFLKDKACALPKGRTCPYFTLPTLPSFARCKLSKYCTGIECCLDVKLKIAKWSFKAWALLDPCKFVFSFGFEKWMFNDTLFTYKWGVPVKKNIANTIALEYTIGKSEDNRYFLLSVKFSINLDKYSINIPPIDLLDKAKIPIPVCNQKISLPNRLVFWQDPAKSKDEASAITLTRLGMDTKLLQNSKAIKPFTTDNNKRCSHFTLTKKLPAGISLHVMDECTGIEARILLDLKIYKRMFKAWILIDPCNLTFSVGFEKWSMNKTLSAGLFGHAFREKIGALTLEYIVDKTADNRDFIFTLKVGLCLDGKCLPETKVIDKAMMPIPFCAKDGSFKWPSFDLVNIGGKQVKGASALVMNRMGVDDEVSLIGSECTPPASSSVVCPYVKLPTFPLDIKCELTEHCTGIKCCASIDLKIVKRNFKFWAILDPCEFSLSIGFERVHYNRSLNGYDWGTKQTLKIGYLNVHYTIDINGDKEFIVHLDLQLCLDSNCITKQILKKHTMPIPFCKGVPGNFAISWPSVKEYGSLLYNILGVGLDFFKPKPCNVQSATVSCPGLTMPTFAKTHCELKKNCLGIQCCFEYDLDVSKVKMSFYFYIDQCKNELHFGLENKAYTVSLKADYDGKKKVQAIGSMLSVKYVLFNTGYTFKASLELDWCWKNPFTKKKTCGNYEFLKEASFKQDDCPTSRKRRSVPDIPPLSHQDREKRSLVGSLKDAMKTGEDIWSITNSLLKNKKSGGQIKDYFDKLKKKYPKVGLVANKILGTGHRAELAAVAGQGIGSYVRGNRKAAGGIKVEGGEALTRMLGKVESIRGRLDEVFTPGSGLTKIGSELLGAQLAGMTIGEIIAMIDMQNLDPIVVFKLLKDIRKLFAAIYNDLIDAFLSGNLLEFAIGDLHLKKEFKIGPNYMQFYKYRTFFMIWIIPCTFEFGIQGYVGLDIEIGAKVLQMWVYGIATPYVGILVYGEITVCAGCFLMGKLRIEGTICELRFPTMADTYFNKFPLDVSLRMDVVLIPLILKMNAKVIMSINLGFKKFKKTVFNVDLYKYQAPAISKTIFDTHTQEDDISGPVFEAIATKPSGTKYDMKLHDDTKANNDKSRKRSISSNQCVVKQLKKRDYTDPALEISAKATDDVSQVKLVLNIGYVPGGTEVYKRKEMSGQSTVLTELFSRASGRKLFFQICGSNSGGTNACVDCTIPTYDITKPVLRVVSDFLITSNHHVLEGSYKGFDDSKVEIERVGYGLGKGLLDDQVVAWKGFSSDAQRNSGRSGDDKATLIATGRDGEDWFTVQTEGRLVTRVTERLELVHSPNQCARHCLSYVPQKCMSFNYNFGSDGACELLEGIQSIDNTLGMSKKFYYFERLGVGSTITFSRKDLNLKHNDLHYINVHAHNVLGFENNAGSRGILTDFTLPTPGPLGNYSTSNETLEFLSCDKLVEHHKDKWGKYCIGVDSTKNNHRQVVDGPGAKTVFNGQKPFKELLYTRANRYLIGNWDGFSDLESGIRGYTLAAGRNICVDKIKNHHDPHNHLFHESAWTHLGTINAENQLEDGRYYLTVRAFNKADYGGPLAVTVCHHIPLTIDNSPPIFENITDIEYNATHWLMANHSARDPESRIQKMYACLGRTTKGCEVLDWLLLGSNDDIAYIYKLPDGIPVWVKASAYNHVDLYTVAVSDYAIMVDESPPIAGEVYDGHMLKVDLNYTKDAHKICANWFDFMDPQSGISMIELSVGTAPLGVDIVNRHHVSHLDHSACIDLKPYNKTLVHRHKYCFTVTAWNGGINRKFVNGSSDCVTVDLTKPENGEFIDGHLDGLKDLQISSMATIVAGQYKDFKDPESGIVDEEVQVEVAGSPTKDYAVAHSYESVLKNPGNFQWGHFHLKHKNRVRSTIRVTNGARATNQKTTDGYLVDLTSPELDYICDGKKPERDISFQTSDNEMSVNYRFHDDESDVDHYRVFFYEFYENTRRLIGESKPLPGDQTVYTNSSLKIRNGASVFGMVESENTAVPGLSASFLTSGVKVDKTPPVMISLYTGVNAGDHEELYDDSVIQSDTKGILASWKGKDSESGIEDYQVCVGTKVDKCDELYWRSMGTAEDGYISGLDLSVSKTSGKLYYVRVRATNGAGQTSQPITGTKVTILNGDITGHPIDGPDGTEAVNQRTIGDDVDVTLDDHTVTMQFEGFKSHEYGIKHIEWAIGTSPNGEEVQPFMAEGLVQSDGSDSLIGQFGAGKASAAVDLEHGKKYHTSVRATTYEGKILEATTDGFMVDHTPPEIIITSLGLNDRNKEILTEGNVIYQQTDTLLSATWRYTEDVSGIAFAEMAASSIAGEADIHPLTNMGRIRADRISSIPDQETNSTIRPRKGGVPNILEIYAGNEVGLISYVASAVILIDDTPPSCGTVTCPKYTKVGATGVSCSWSGFSDSESRISSYEFGIGSTAGKDDVYTFKKMTAITTKHLATNFKIPMKATTKYFATVKATNMLGLHCEASSDAISMDDTAPVPGVIVETTDSLKVNFSSPEDSGKDQRNKWLCANKEECQAIDVTCQSSMDRIGASWTHFADPETGIASYHLAVGTSKGGGQIKPFFSVPTTLNHYLITGLDLTGKLKIYVTIRAYNGAGMSSSAFSNGVSLSYVAQGLQPPQPLSVWDVDNDMEDKDYQTDMERLSARWNFNGDPCLSTKYEWRIERMDGKVIQDYTTTFGQPSGSYDGLKMKDGEAYMFKVRTTNALGESFILRSDGITIRKDTLVPGRVSDGVFEGFDLMYSPTTSEADAHWQDFGRRDKKVFTVKSGNAGVKEEKKTEKNQVVRYYEVALGTDRRFAHTRNNVVPYTNVGKNTSVIFEYLKMHQDGMYYFTVRAHSASSAMAEVTSNGFKAGYGDGVRYGEIVMPDFWGNTSHLLTKWKDYTSEVGMLFYHVGVTKTALPKDLLCRKLILSKASSDNLQTKLFLVIPMRNVGSSTMIELFKLNLTHNANHLVYVVGTDQAGLCNITSRKFLVDATAPLLAAGGGIKIGPYWHLGSSYTNTTDTINVEWKGYSDPESQLKRFEMSLWSAPNCNPGSAVLLSWDWITLTPDFTTYNLIDLKLITAVPYHIKLRAYNKAGLFTETVSKPVLLDTTKPTAGDVVNGHNFTHGIIWQNSTTQVHGNFLHYSTNSGTPCPDRPIKFTSGWRQLNAVGLGVKKGKHWGIQYAGGAVISDGDDSVAIRMTKVGAGYSYLQSGATFFPADTDGDFRVTIQAAGGDGLATTSVLLWDGPENELQEYNWENEPDWTGNNGICKCCFKTPQPAECPCDCKAYKQANVSNKTNSTSSKTNNATNTTKHSGSVALKTAPTIFTRQRGCGFQLIAGKTPYTVLWCSSFNDTSEILKVKRTLDFDPSVASYSYRIRVYARGDDPQKPQWCFAVYEVAKNDLLGELCGIEAFSTKTKLVLHLWNKDNFIPKESTWLATARFSGLRFPPLRSLLCRYGNVFRGGDSAVISYEAGIGTSPLKTDVEAFKVIARPCVPCINACHRYICDHSCPTNKVENIKFTLKDLSLPIMGKSRITGNNSAIVYFLTVKVILGSGASAVSSSKGFQIDITPPVLDMAVNVTYIDVEQGQYKPVNYQSSKTTIRAIWNCIDKESMVVENQWAIGRKPGLEDVQPFKSVGKNPGGTNASLGGILQHNHMYYITIKCINAAGLGMTHVDTKGVKVLLEKPVTRDVKTNLPGTKSFAKPVLPKSAKTANDATTISVGWSKPRDKNIKRVDVGIGTSSCTDGKTWDDNIFAFTWLAKDDAGVITIKGGAVYSDGKKLDDLCMFVKPSKNSNYVKKATKKNCMFKMEIGRTIFVCLKLCNLADKCTLKDGGSVTFVKDGKVKVASSQNGKAISVTITKNTARKRAVGTVADIKTPDGMLPGQTLIVGLLDSSDAKATYGSDASIGFKKYIQDPVSTQTMTERALKGRLTSLPKESFFVSSVGHLAMPGPLIISVAYLAQQKTATDRPMLLHWDTGKLAWVRSLTTCTSTTGPKESFDTAKLVLNTLVCETHTPQTTQTTRRKRATGGGFFKKETQFLLAGVARKPVNNAPVITKEPMLSVAEDSSILTHTLTATDKDGDQFAFSLDGSKPAPTGTATIAPDGKLTYSPCMDCVGIDTVYYKVTEVNMGDVPALTSTTSILIAVTDVQDAPELFVSQNGKAVFTMASTLNNIHIVNMTVEQDTGHNKAYSDLVFLVGAYDRDIADVLTIVSQSPVNGELKLGGPVQTKPTLPKSCADQKADALPCTGLSLPHGENKLSWVTRTITYKPKARFYGQDSFVLKAFDNTGLESNKVTVKLYVLQNLCQNQGTCRGLQEDLRCTDHRRASVRYLDFYTCSCTGGWSGPVCNVDHDDCLSVPCAFPLTCFDKLGGHECSCPLDWPDCDGPDHLTPAIASIVCILVVFGVLIGIAVWLHKKRKARYDKYKRYDDDDSISDRTDSPSPEVTARRYRRLRENSRGKPSRYYKSTRGKKPFSVMDMPGVKKHVTRIGTKGITPGKEGDDMELTTRRPSIVPPVGKGNPLTSGDNDDLVDETRLDNATLQPDSRRGSDIKIAWQKSGASNAMNLAFTNPAFEPHLEETNEANEQESPAQGQEDGTPQDPGGNGIATLDAKPGTDPQLNVTAPEQGSDATKQGGDVAVNPASIPNLPLPGSMEC